MTDPTPDRPLVTFALFAYNQEKYIREAVEGAFSQTYEPLEIILSDDCSSDRTFEIMQEMTAAYEGPHAVKVRQSEVNLGTLAHLQSVCKVAIGEIMVVAAGDDISLPERTKTLSTFFSDAFFLAGSSDDCIINDDGESLEIDQNRILKRDNWHKLDPTWIHGATACYRLSFLRQLPESDNKLLYEDMIFSDFMKGISGRTFRTKSRLIKYRYHTQNLSSRHKKNIDEAEASAMLRWKRASEAKSYCASALMPLHKSNPLAQKLSKRFFIEHKFFYKLSHWTELGFIDRLRLLRLAIANNKPNTAIVRLFGYSFFKLVRQAQRGNFLK